MTARTTIYSLIIVVCLLVTQGAANATTLGVNLLTNGDAETGDMTGWTTGSGVGLTNQPSSNGWLGSGASGPSGTYYFYGGTTGAPFRTDLSYQEVDISDLAASIDAGLISYTVSGLIGKYSVKNEPSHIQAVFFDSPGGTQLGNSQELISTASGAVQLESDTNTVPTGTRTIRYNVWVVELDGTTWASGGGDDFNLMLTSPVWDGSGGGDTNWNTVTNWADNADPGTVEVQFGTGGTEASMNVSDMVKSVTFNRAGNFDIVAGGGTLTINEGITTTTANNFGIAAPVTLGASQTFDVFDGSSLTVSGAIGDGGNSYAITKTGAGTLTLTGTNTFTGGTTINAGTLIVSGGDALADAGAVSIAAVPGAILQLDADETIGSLSGGSYPANGQVNLQDNTLTVGDASNTSFSGNITGTGTLIKQGSGSLKLAGRNDGSFTGETIINAGTVIAEAWGLGTSNITLADVDGVTLESSGTAFSFVGSIAGGGSNGGNIILYNTLQLDGSQNTTFNGVISGTGILRRSGTGTTTLTGNNTYSGGTILGGALILGHDNALGTGTLNMDSWGDPTLQSNNDARSVSNAIATGGNVLTISGASNLALSGIISGTGSLTKSGSGALTLSGTNTYSGGTTVTAGTLTGTTASLQGAVTNNAAVVFDQTADGTYAGIMSGSGSLTKTGTGTLTLSGTNIYSGGTTLNGGTLSLANSSALGTGGITVLGSTIDYADGLNIANTIDLQNDATLNVSTGSATQSGIISETSGSWGIIKTGAGTLTLSGNNTYSGGTTLNAGTIILGSDAALGTGGLTLGGDAALESSDDARSVSNAIALGGNGLTVWGASNLALGGVVSGTGSLTKSGTGTLTLSGVNTYSGVTTIDGGTVSVGAVANLGAAGSGLTFGGGTLHLTNAIDLTDDITLIARGGTFDSDLSNTFSGIISGPGGLVKQGTGTLTLTGTNTYSGWTTLNAGTIVLGADAALGTGGLALGGDAALQSNDDARSISNAIATDGNGLTVSGASNLALDGVVSGSGSLSKTGTGTLTLSGTNIYSGGTTLNGGTLSLANSSALGTGGITVLGSTIDYADGLDIANTIDLQNDVTLNVSTGTATQSGAIGETGGSWGIIKTGAGTLILSGTNTYTGGTTINAGTLYLGSGGTILGPITLNGGTMQYGSGNATDYSGCFSTAAGQQYNIDTNGEDVILGCALVSSGGSLTKSGIGTLTLTGTNTYDGGTTV